MKDNIKLKGLKGTWYIIEEKDNLCLLENEQLGDETPCVITDKDFNVILLNVYNGWLDYEEYLCNRYGKDIYKDERLIFEFVPEGIKHLCAIVDRKGSLMKYGEMENVKPYYMKLLKMYAEMHGQSELIFIDFNDLKLTPEYKYIFMDYMINTSCNGEIIYKYLTGSVDNLIEWLKDLSKDRYVD